MDKAIDFESEKVCVHVRFPEWAIFFFMMMMMMMLERRAAAQASAKRERRRAGMSAANVGAIADKPMKVFLLLFRRAKIKKLEICCK